MRISRWRQAGRQAGRLTGRQGREDHGKADTPSNKGKQEGETSWETSRETSWETNWETRGTRPRECGHTIHQRASWEKGGKASGRQTRHPTAAGRPVNAHLHSHSVSVCFTAAMTCLCWYQTIPWLDIQQVFSVLVCTKRTLTKLNANWWMCSATRMSLHVREPQGT